MRKATPIVIVVFICAFDLQGSTSLLERPYCTPAAEKAQISKFNNLAQCAVPANILDQDGRQVPANPYFTEEFPDWFDLDLASIGQEFGRKNVVGLMYIKFIASILFIGDPTVQKVSLNMRPDATPEESFQGAFRDVLHEYLWVFEDIRGGNASNIFQSFHGVRSKHLIASSKAIRNDEGLKIGRFPDLKPGENPKNLNLKIWNAFHADLVASDLNRTETKVERDQIWLNQYGMSIRHFQIVGLAILRPERMMIAKATDLELEAFLHFFAFIGKGVGVEDEYNICLQPNLKTARAYFKQHLEQNLAPSLFHLDYEQKWFIETFMKGANNALGPPEREVEDNGRSGLGLLLMRVLEDILDIPALNLKNALSPNERAANAFIKTIVHPNVQRISNAVGYRVMRGIFRRISRLKLGFDFENLSDIAEKAYS